MSSNTKYMSTSVNKKKPECKYGENCRRKNRAHFNEFNHPPLQSAEKEGPPFSEQLTTVGKKRQLENSQPKKADESEHFVPSDCKKQRFPKTADNPVLQTVAKQLGSPDKNLSSSLSDQTILITDFMKPNKIASSLASQQSTTAPDSQSGSDTEEILSGPDGEETEELDLSALADTQSMEVEDAGTVLEVHDESTEEEDSEDTLLFTMDELRDLESYMSDLPPKELPSTFGAIDVWSPSYVKLPCSSYCTDTVYQKTESKNPAPIWGHIYEKLSKARVQSSKQLQELIRSVAYKRRYWDFQGLSQLIDEEFTYEERKEFFMTILPGIIHLALSLPHRMAAAIPLLKPCVPKSVSLSTGVISSILANAFFCTIPPQDDNENHDYPNINFDGLYRGKRGVTQKLRCLLHYFSRVAKKPPTGSVIYHRVVLQQPPDWAASTEQLASVSFVTEGLIEDVGHEHLQCDFANMMIGGGVLAGGCLQEEIRFVICPELIISLLFTACLEPLEAVVIIGAERYCKYKGYASTFEFDGPFFDKTPMVKDHRVTRVVAMDAKFYGTAPRSSRKQYSVRNLLRDLNKAYTAFQPLDDEKESGFFFPVATGNWGCGNFGGYPDLKAILQVMACSQAGRAMKYFTFSEKALQQSLTSFVTWAQDKKITVGQIWTAIADFSLKMKERRHRERARRRLKRARKKAKQVAEDEPNDLPDFDVIDESEGDYSDILFTGDSAPDLLGYLRRALSQ